MARGRKKRHGAPSAPAAPDTGGFNTAALRLLAQAQLGPGLNALAAQAQDGALPRTTEYLASTERGRGPLSYARAKPHRGVPFAVLRAIGDQALINSAIHSRRADGMRPVCEKWSGRRHQPGWAVVHKQHHDPKFDASTVADLDKRTERAGAILQRPHPRYAKTLDGLMLPLLDDLLTIDRPCINVIKDSTGTVPIQMAPVDGATIWPVDLWTDRYVRLSGLAVDHPGRMFEIGAGRACGEFGVDLTNVAYVQIDPTRGLVPVAFLAEDEILVGVANPSSRLEDWGYGRSPCERAWLASTLYLFGIGYIVDFFRNGMANMLGTLEGINDPDAVTLINLLRTHHSGPGRHFHTPFIPLPPGAKLTLQPSRTPAKEMEFSESIHHFSMLLCADYSEDPTSINLSNRGPHQSTLSEPNRHRSEQIKRSEGLENNIRFLFRMLSEVVERIDPDLMVIPAGLDDEKEELEVNLRTKRQDYHMAVNEALREEGRDELELLIDVDGEKVNVYDHPKWAAQAMLQAKLQQQAAEQQRQHQAELQQQAGGPGGEPGGPGGPGGLGSGGDQDADGGAADGDETGGPGGRGVARPPSHLRWEGDGGARGAGRQNGGGTADRDDVDRPRQRPDARDERGKAVGSIEIFLDE